VRAALKGTDAAAIKTAGDKLSEIWQAVSTELYQTAEKKSGGGRGPTEGQPGQPPKAEHPHDEEPVIDAEVVEERQPA